MTKRTLDELIAALENMGATVENANGNLKAIFADVKGIDIATEGGLQKMYIHKGSTVIYPPQYGYKIAGNFGNGVLLFSPA